MPYNPDNNVSPSQINKFARCRFAWYCKYVLDMPDVPNFYLERGILVHEICERISRFVPDKSFTTLNKIVAFHVKNAKRDIDAKWPELSAQYKEADAQAKKSTIEMAENYLRILRGRALPNEKKYGAARAWSYALPKLVEKKISSDRLKLGGRIDSVVEKDNMDGTTSTVIVDHKTSKFFDTLHSDDYFRQLMLYALLWLEETGRAPDVVATEFLTSGETIAYPVGQQTIADMETLVAQARKAMEETAKLAPHEVFRNVQKTCNFCDRRRVCEEDGYLK